MIIEKSEIAEKLKQLKAIGSPKMADKPSGVLLKDNSLKANNLRIALTVPLSVHTDEAFVIPINAIALIESLPNGEIEIKGNDKTVTVSCGKIKSKFPTFPVADFTEPKELTEKPTLAFQLSWGDIADGIEKIMYVCPADPAKPVLSGIYFDGNGKHLNLVACDGVRIAISVVSTTQKVNVVVPRDAIKTLLAVGDTSKDIKFYTEDKRIIAEVGEYTIYALLNSDSFPDYRAIFPKDCKFVMQVDRNEIANALNRCLICQGKELQKPHTILKCAKDSNSISVILYKATNKFSDDVACNYSLEASEDMLIGINTKFLYEAVKATTDEKIVIQYYGSVHPFVVCDNTLRQLIAPVRLDEAAKKV